MATDVLLPWVVSDISAMRHCRGRLSGFAKPFQRSVCAFSYVQNGQLSEVEFKPVVAIHQKLIRQPEITHRLFHRVTCGLIFSRLGILFRRFVLGQIGVPFSGVAQAGHVERDHGKSISLKLGGQAVRIFEFFDLIGKIPARSVLLMHQQNHRRILARQGRVVVQAQETAIGTAHGDPEILGVAL